MDDPTLDDQLPTLCTLGEDALLLVLEMCDSVTLCALARSTSLFTRPAPGEGLSLPERAAWATMRRHFASGAARPYEKGAAEQHRQVLSLHERGMLRPGVLHDVPLHAVEGAGSGWEVAYQAPYQHRTSDADLDEAVPRDARYVLLGALSMTGARSTDRYERGQAVGVPLPDRETLEDGSALAFSLLAWGRRDTVLKATHGEKEFEGGATRSDNLEAGVHFYRWWERRRSLPSPAARTPPHCTCARCRCRCRCTCSQAGPRHRLQLRPGPLLVLRRLGDQARHAGGARA